LRLALAGEVGVLVVTLRHFRLLRLDDDADWVAPYPALRFHDDFTARLRREQEAAALPHAADVLRSMSQYLARQPAFSYHAEIEFDQVLPRGPTIRLAGAVDVAASRPGSLHVDRRDDVSDRTFWREGGRATLLAPVAGTYAEVSGPKDIDGMLAKLEKEFGTSFPLTEFAESDAAAVLERGVDLAHHVGVHDVEGAQRHHVVLHSGRRRSRCSSRPLPMPSPAEASAVAAAGASAEAASAAGASEAAMAAAGAAGRAGTAAPGPRDTRRVSSAAGSMPPPPAPTRRPWARTCGAAAEHEHEPAEPPADRPVDAAAARHDRAVDADERPEPARSEPGELAGLRRRLPRRLTVQANGQSYEYLNGVFYHASYGPSGQLSHSVVQALLGATLASLPQGVKPNKVNGAAFYNYGSTWFRACYSGGQTVYRVVWNPLV